MGAKAVRVESHVKVCDTLFCVACQTKITTMTMIRPYTHWKPGLKHACVELAVDRVKKWEVEWNVVGLGTNHDAPFPSPDRCGGVSGSFFSSTTAVTRERPRK